MSKYHKRYNWEEIQAYYDQGYSIRKTKEYFGIGGISTINAAIKRGEFKSRPHSYYETPNDVMFQSNSPTDRAVVRRRILRDSLLPYECASCDNNGDWNGRKLVLELHHKNGINKDHRLINLEWQCPNCHTQTESWGR